MPSHDKIHNEVVKLTVTMNKVTWLKLVLTKLKLCKITKFCVNLQL